MGKQLHVFFFPFMAHGHMIPTLDLAKLFAARGVRATIVTTPLNAPHFAKSIQRATDSGSQISVRTIKFPAAESGLPENCESVDQLTSDDLLPLFFMSTAMLKQPLEDLLQELRPDCLVADMFFPWATGIAAKFGIPRLVFHGMSFFSLSAQKSLSIHKPELTFSSEDDDEGVIVIPDLPHEIKFIKTQMQIEANQGDFSKFVQEIMDSDRESFGVVVNSFYELEPEYVNHYRKVLGVRAWHIGPVSLCNRDIEDKAQRGKEASIGENECLKWLDSKQPDSVVYVCFGSVAKITNSQLTELATGLEDSGQNFIWVVRKGNDDSGDDENKWLPEGFEERTKERGLIIRGWAPQVLILDHVALGGFVTHCGWNSILEGVCAGLPLVTWPSFAEQFFNEKLVTQVLRIGVGVGVLKWAMIVDGIGREAIAKAIEKVMIGEEAEEMRKRVIALKDGAKKAVEVGGSSYSDLNALLQELGAYQVPEKGQLSSTWAGQLVQV